MKDFPVFPTEHGVASLVLKEIPYRGEAYIRVQDVQPGELELLLAECASFCRMAGAEKIYVRGHEELAGYPLHTAVYEMRGTARVDKDKLEYLFPVTEATVEKWREVYNARMRHVDNAGTLTHLDQQKLVNSGGAYFVHRDGELLGIGWLEEETLLCVASAKPGAGERVLNTLMSLVEGAELRLEVASTNERAIALYERMGFAKTRAISRWYKMI